MNPPGSSLPDEALAKAGPLERKNIQGIDCFSGEFGAETTQPVNPPGSSLPDEALAMAGPLERKFSLRENLVVPASPELS